MAITTEQLLERAWQNATDSRTDRRRCEATLEVLKRKEFTAAMALQKICDGMDPALLARALERITR